MKIIIAGSRTINYSVSVIQAAVDGSNYDDISEVVSGAARGVDSLGEQWAARYMIPVKRFPAKWNEKGKAAGFLRNNEMADYADRLIAIWDGESKGTLHMINVMAARNKPVFVYCPQLW
jgi:hypothetical protein